MDLSPRFSSGLELANFAVTSDILLHSWAAIKNLTNSNRLQSLPFSVRYNSYDDIRRKCKIIAFEVSLNCTEEFLEGNGDLESPATTRKQIFEFLCSKSNPEFSINKALLTLFHSFYEEHQNEISELIDKTTTPLIITGHCLGGSIASLFTLWLLDRTDLTTKNRPLCITFGSPLLGNSGLREGILQYPTWNSCFLHVVANNDPLPRLFLYQSPSLYTPFGTFLFCSESGSACYDLPQSITELLKLTHKREAENRDLNQGLWNFDYESILQELKRSAIYKAVIDIGRSDKDALHASLMAELQAIGVVVEEQLQQQNMNINGMIGRFQKELKDSVLGKMKVFDPSEKLNERKKIMAQLEWYKKVCKKEKLGYYDSYKYRRNKRDLRVTELKKELTIYWEKLVKEVENKPQKEGVSLRTRWLLAGLNYRRMVEPLDIAEYYHEKKRNYLTRGRSYHYIKLEEWHRLEKEKKRQEVNSRNDKRNDVTSILTEDSCFWVYVEEALIECEVLRSNEVNAEKKELSRNELNKFEKYVMGLIQDYAVSPEIFLPNCSFMRWWEDYNKIMGSSYNSDLTELMRTGKYKNYAEGYLD